MSKDLGTYPLSGDGELFGNSKEPRSAKPILRMRHMFSSVDLSQTLHQPLLSLSYPLAWLLIVKAFGNISESSTKKQPSRVSFPVLAADYVLSSVQSLGSMSDHLHIHSGDDRSPYLSNIGQGSTKAVSKSAGPMSATRDDSPLFAGAGIRR